jgi:hypothetical protein
MIGSEQQRGAIMAKKYVRRWLLHEAAFHEIGKMVATRSSPCAEKAMAGIFGDLSDLYAPSKSTRKCTGCNGKGEYQLMGPVTQCDVCGGTGVETIGEKAGAAPDLIVTDERPYPRQSTLDEKAGLALSLWFDGSKIDQIPNLYKRPLEALESYLKNNGWKGKFELFAVLKWVQYTELHFRRS